MLRINKSKKTGIDSNNNGVFFLFYPIFPVSCCFFMIQYQHQRVAWKALHNLHKCALFTNPLLKWSYSSSVLPIQVYSRKSNPSYNHTIGQYCLTLYPIEISELHQAACLAIKHTSSIFGVFLSYIFLPLHSVGNHSS